ncbi:MAG: site-specific integrase [Acidiferrobacterales bacterium]
MATFRKRLGPKGRPVWQAQIIRLGERPKFKTFDSKTAAIEWARQIEGAMDRGEWVDRTEGDRLTLGQAFLRYEKEILPRKAASAQPAEQGRFRALRERRIAKIALTRLGGADIAEYIREREGEGVSANTIRLDLASISHTYTVARTAWGMPYLVNPVPLAKTARPRLPAGRDRRLKDGEEEQLLAAARSAFALVIRWALATAMRRSEIAGLTWDRVDIKQRSVHLPVTKNGTARTVPLSREALAVLASFPHRKDGLVFGMSVNAIRLAWKRTVASTKIVGLTFHDLRHEAISRLFERTDLDAMEIARISGHRTLSMLSRYTHLRAHHLAERLDGAPRVRA